MTIARPSQSQINGSTTSVADHLTTNIRNLNLNGHVGFDSLPDQLVNKSIENGFDFNILCIGDTGMGKSTLMNALFNTNFDSTPSAHTLAKVKLKAHTYELEESNVRLKLTICDTIGYGDQVNKGDSIKIIVDYLDTQFEAYLQEELKINRNMSKCHDSRIHACLYFVSPTGHGLRSLDIFSMKQLDNKVNIIPIIAKADTITALELQRFKKQIMDELVKNGVKIYQFPVDDETVATINTEMNKKLPFAVVASTDFVKIGGKSVRARQYSWGTVQIENEAHCDFVKLREMLIRTNMEDLREVTHMLHFELYRQTRMLQMGFSDVDSNNKPVSFQETFESKRSQHLAILNAKEEEVRQIFVQRVKKKETELKDNEKELYAKFDELKLELLAGKTKLEENQRALDDERLELQKRKQQYTFSSITTLGRGKKK